MRFEIRPALPSDSKDLYQMILELAVFEEAAHEVKCSPSTLELQLSMAQPPFKCLMVTLDSKCVGFALYFLSYSTWRGKPGIWLEDLYVREAFRGRGVGTALFERLVDEVKAFGGARLEWPVLEWNVKAHDFYRKQGAKALTQWRTWRLDFP